MNVLNESNLLKLARRAVLALFLVAGGMNSQAGEPGAEQCLDPETCPIPYVRLAKQASEPFMFDGKVIDERHPRYRHYGESIHRFPNVRSCLVDSERAELQPDLRRMDWGAVRKLTEVDVCVFRIASSIEDVDTVKEWLQLQGFHVGRDIKLWSKDHVPNYETERMFIVGSVLSVERFREIFPRPWLWRLVGFERVHNYSLGISFSRSGQVVGVSSNAVIK